MTSRAEWPNAAWPGYGFLYVIATNEDGPCKIGVSIRPKTRIMGLETGAGVRYPLVFISKECSDYREVEEELKERLQPARLVGEWFDMPFAWGIEAIDMMKPYYLSTQKRRALMAEVADRVKPISRIPSLS